MAKNNFEIGDIVTLKSHPLAFQEDGEIDAYVNQIPPLMCVKEVHIEKKKRLYSNEVKKSKIADNVKYLCVYFNQYRMIFEEKYLYQDVLISFKDITFHSKTEKTKKGHITLINEALKYKVADYEFGKRIFFKTYKLEKRKKFKNAGKDSKSTVKTTMTHTSPAFIINGFKPNDQKTIYNPKNGELQRKCSEELFKVIWYNAYQEKFSEEYLPKEFFIDDERIYK
ncbi:hypothetical protein [Marixanthomonas spongiae]|uniref:Uncharacterized protein n=1 Tax=Marixanthomonas spongiae TaxID=2174845 RepID=A0A2U0HT36_9FLAO|nr:hypothetical protein [Marixanthomonas spongiae]PVW11997.1 hypothetical protein DDV96_15375 [Marixanthomonas spongiae]